MAKSILQRDKRCFITGRIDNLHKHHIYGGGNRKNSEKNGFWVYLTAEYHNMSNRGVHFDRKLDLRLKEQCQRKFEETHTRAEFMAIIGKNHINDEQPPAPLEF